MNQFLSNFTRNAIKSAIIAIILLFAFNSQAQTTPSITFTTTATGSFNFELRAVKANTSVKVDWGDGKQLSYTIGTDSTAVVSPAVLAGTTIISVFGSEINYINVSSKKLTNINVGNSTSLVKLICNYNQLNSLDVSKNTELSDLECKNNVLTALDVSKNILLKNLNCFSNTLKTLDISKNINLSSLNFSYNGLSAINVSKNTSLVSIDCVYNQLTTLDVTSNLLLTRLNCYSNLLTSLNVSKNTSLTFLNSGSNKLTVLDVSKNISIKYLSCRNNNLTTLDVSKNTIIGELYCQYNQISTLDISKNAALKYLDCSNNFFKFQSLPKIEARFKSYAYSPQGVWSNDAPGTSKTIDLTEHLTTLDADGKPQTTSFLWKNGDMIMKEGTDYRTQAPGIFVFINVPTLLFFCEMTNPAFPDLKGKDAVKFAFLMNPAITLNSNSLNEFYFTLDSMVKNNLIIVNYGEGRFYSNDIWNTIPTRKYTYPVKIYGAAITNLRVQNAGLNSLDVKNCNSLTELDCAYNAITALDISKNLTLTELYCYDNKLSILDVSKNPTLTVLNCSGNQITSLNVKQNPKLESLVLWTNKITTLDLSLNTQLKVLGCSDNQLIALNVSNNPLLTDLYCDINKLTSIGLDKNTALLRLNCSANQINTLNVSMNTGLTELYCYSNKLTSLDVSKNIFITDLYCYENQISSLDVSRNTNLSILNCGTNKLDVLDVTKNLTLNSLTCYDNNLTKIDLSKNVALTSLSVRTNQISSLDISKNPELSFLSCRDNKLNELDVTKNSKLTELYCYGNNLTFGKLPQTNTQYAKYQYAPQKALNIAKSTDKGKAIDLSSQLTAKDISGKQQTTTYTWKTKTGNTLTDGKDYNVTESGKFVFLNIPKDSIYCEMSNAAFPDFKDKDIYKTTNVNVELLRFTLGNSLLSEFCATTSEPSASQVFLLSVSTSNGNDVIVTAPINFEVSLGGITYDSSLTLRAYTGATQSIYVRIKSDATSGMVSGNVVIAGLGYDTEDVALAGTKGNPTIIPNGSLLGYLYDQGAGPSSSKTLTFTANHLCPQSGNMTVSGTNFEVSKDGSNWSLAVTFTYTNGDLVSSTLYTRLKAGLIAGTYSENLSFSGGGASATIPCTGTVQLHPDITVQNVTTLLNNVSPLGKLKISWQIKNVGGTITGDGWRERVFLISDNGESVDLGTIYYSQLLEKGAIVARQAEFVLPQYPGIDGNAKVQVKVIPNINLGEIPDAQLNNSAESDAYLLVNKKLELKTQKSIVFENDPNPIPYQLFRSGSRATEELFTISNSNPDRLKIPASVTIPAGSSGAVFYAYSIDNQVLNSDYSVTISASGNQYETAIDILTIKDNEIPSLKVTTSKTQINEGETITLTATRDLVTNKPVTVSLSTNKPSQWTFPSSFVIPANTASVDIPVLITNDNIPELKSDAIIYVSASGFTTGQATASIVDDDIPQVSLELLVDTVSEAAGVFATWGVIKRVKGDDNITVNLSSNPSNALFFPASITLPKGALEQKFNIGVVDNNEVDGYRKVAISGSVYISSCSCGTSAENGGIVTANLVIADNDGPSLSVSVNPLSLPEGKLNAGTLTISRNTSTNQALTVIISHNDPSEVNIQISATILAGQKTVQVPINTINDNIEDGNQMVTIQASAATFSSGFGYIFVTDLNKPDLVITDITLNNNTAATNEVIEITGSAFNSGFATAPSGVKINFYCSKDKTIDANDILLGEYVFPSPIAQNTPANFLKTLDVPDQTGNYFILAKINPAETITELEYFNNVSDAVDLTIAPEYMATAITDNNLYFPNTTIPIHGSAFNNKNTKMPNVDVDVYILNNGTRRELKARTNNLGEYSVEYTPIANESGHYTIGGCYPKQSLSVAQDAFDIPGIRLESASNIIWDMKQGQTIVGKIAVTNTSEASLNHIVIKSDKLPSGCQIKFDTIAVLSGKQTREFNFTLKATELTSGMNYEKINFQITSNEKIATEFPAYYYCQELRGQLKADPVSINTSITKGKSRLYELHVYNNGAGETGTVTISLPNVSWMKLVSPATLTNLAPQDTATVILDFSPTADIPLNTPISGNIALNCANGNGLKVPYLLEVVSAETGELKVDVVDEYTYYTVEKPHVKNAHVVVRHPFSGAIVADGYTNSDGTFSVSNLPEGNYKMKVDADKHESFQTTITIDPGRENVQSVFLSFQAITYTWEVVPTEIQDKYEVKLVMKYETNVPVPVVITEMPEAMPGLFNDETYPFMVTLTNKGLITALDVQVKFPQNDPEYEFVTNFTKMDLLAQQSIQVPVVMKRRATLKSAKYNQSTSSTGPCKAEEITMFGWKCGDDHKWSAVSKSFTYTPRKCEPGKPLPFKIPDSNEPIRCVPDSLHFNPYIDIPTVSSDNSCDPCLIAIGLATIGCFGGAAMSTIQCGLSNLDLEYTTLDAFTCAAGYYPIVGCGVGLLGAAYECNKHWIESHYPIIPKVLEYPILKSANSETKSSLSPILMQSMANLAYVLYAIKGYDEWITEFMRPMDWYSKVNKIDFFTLIDPFTKNKTPIQSADLILIQQKMIGTDITANEIAAFASRWNNTLTAWSKNINSPNADFLDIIDKNQLNQYAQKADSANSYAVSQGYSSIGEMYNKAMTDIKEQLETGRSSVCASVSINITQKVVMTREAFEGTLTIFNGHTSEAMKDIKLNLEIKDENGVLSNDLFQIDTKSLSVLTGIDGTGVLNAQKKGSATVLFIPEKGAAPQVPKSYSFGGSFSYLDPFTGVRVTKPLFPVTLQVNPSPDLYLHYFMQRDILGDNPLTADIEPIVPAEFAVMIQNNGFGTAKNVRIESAQPKIVENEKGLAINFALTGSNLNGQPKQLGLTNIDFGNIPAQKTAIGQWWFTSDLLGHFVSYDAKVTHLDSHGNPDLSLISGTTLHELIKSIRVYSKVEDGINDFLVNELQDALEFPDVIYLSNGGTLDVYPVVSSSISGSIITGNHEIELTVTPKQQGWNYLKFNDPGNGNYKIISVKRNDGQIIPLDNVWQTYVTLPDGKEPVYENKIHLTDEFATSGSQKYTIRFEAKDQNPLAIVRFENVPASAVTSPLTSVKVVFNKPVDPATFNYTDMTLRIQGGADVIDNSVIVTQIDPVTYKIDLTSKTTQNGYYVLTVQTSQISNLLGASGLVGKQATWTQFINVPAVSEFIGLPDNHIGSSIDFLKLRFNLPIDKTTLLPARFTWTKDGTPVSGTITITNLDTEGKLFQLSGLKAFMSQDGKYSLTVDLPNIKSIDGNKGILTQSVEWEIDQKPPTISKITPSTNGGYDSQHTVSFDILFSEPVNGFGINSLELWKNGQSQTLSQLNFTKKTDSEYLVAEFGMLTYSGGNYLLKVKMKDITDIAGNYDSDTITYEWTVKRTPPKAVTNLHITPDKGFSDSDNITSTRQLSVSMTVNEPDSHIKLYIPNQGNPILLADVLNAQTGSLLLPVNFDYSGNLTLQAQCIDKYNNTAITEIPITIDETAFICFWKDTPQSALKTQPASLQIEFTEKLLDDTKLKNFLKFERDGQSLETKNLTVSKTTEKGYVVTGMDLAGNSIGAYRLVLDVSKLNKYTSGKEGSSLSQIQWSIENSVPIANAGENQNVAKNTLVSLDGTGSSDPNNDALTYLWTAPTGIILSSTSVAKPTFIAPEVATNTNYTFTLVVNDGTVYSVADQVVVTVSQVNKAPIANAGVDQSVNEGTIVTLDGAASSDPDNTAVTYLWTAPQGITLSSYTVAKPTFIAPEVTTNTNYTFTLVVNDGTVNSVADQVVVIVNQVNKAPIASAGADQSMNEGATVTLDGSASSDPDNNTLTYLWTAPAGITLSSYTAAKPTFTAPKVTTITNYTFTLVVNDGTVNSVADQVVVTVKQGNKAPIANAGADQSVNEGTTTTLDGSASSDPDNDALTYLWTAPAGFTLSSYTVAKPTFTAPEVATNTNYTFTLVVNDGTVNSVADQVIITVKQGNKAPMANAGNDKSVNEGTTTTLDGSASSDFDNDALTYLWTAPEGITLSSYTIAKPTFTAPEVTSNTNYTFTLVVNDGTVNSVADQVVITVKQGNKAPIANAGNDQSINEGAAATLDGSASYDSDNDALTYFWTAPTGITLSSYTVAKPTFTAPEVATNTNYTFTLVVNDGTVSSAANQVVVTVNQVNKAPAANAGADQSVNEGTILALDGSASYDPDNDVLTYLWTAPAGITLSSTSVAKPTFTAPEVAANTNYTFTLVINDGTVNSVADQVVVVVKQVNKAPLANAGPDQSANEGTIVSLDGSASYDPDNDVLTYKWTAPEGIILSSTSVAKPTFTAPEVKINTNYTFSLVVNDGTVNSAANHVAVTVNRINNIPVANAGVDQIVDERTTVSLDGTISSDPDNDALTYLWSAPAGIILSSATVAKPTFTAPEIVSNTNYTFSLVVNDGTTNSIADQVVINVTNVDRAPYVKDPIKNISVYKRAPLQIIDLNSVFSDDDFGDVLSYSVSSNTNENVATAKITDTYLILTFSSKNTGTTEIVLTASSNGKEAKLKFTVEVMLSTSIDPLIEDTDVQIYPNPTKGNIHLRFNQTPKAGTLITVYGVTGNLISTTLADNKEEYLNLKGNPAGLYFIKIDQKVSKTYKVVLE